MKFCLATPADFSFQATLDAHGWPQLLPFARDREKGTLERIERLDSGQIVLLRLAESAPGTLEITTSDAADKNEITISEDGDAEEITRRVRRMLQLDLPVAEFHRYCAERPELTHIPAQKQGRMLRGTTLWEDTAKVILTTNTTWAQTKAMNARMVDIWGEPLPSDPTRKAFPTPERIAKTSFADFAAHAKAGYRAGALHNLATAIAGGDCPLEDWQTNALDTPTLWKNLLKLRGVGPYAASCLLLYLGRPERVNADSWARTLVAREVGHAVTDAEVHAFFAKYGDWRGLVYTFYRWRENAPTPTE